MSSTVLGTFGEYNVRLFDLIDGKKMLAIGLIGFAKDDFDKHFWDKYVALIEAVL